MYFSSYSLTFNIFHEKFEIHTHFIGMTMLKNWKISFYSSSGKDNRLIFKNTIKNARSTNLRDLRNPLCTGKTFLKFTRSKTSCFYIKGYKGINVKFENYLAFFFILNVSAPQNSWFCRYSLFAMNFNWASDRFRNGIRAFIHQIAIFWFDVNQPGVQNVDFWIFLYE